MKKHTLIIAMGIVLSFATASAFAQDVQLPQQNEKLESTGQLALRAASPDASFGTKAERIGWVKQGEIVKVISVKQVSTVYGFEVWIEVDAGSQKGWIYDGMAHEALSGNSPLVQQAPSNLIAAN